MRMKVTYNYNIQCCLTAAAKAFALSLFAIPPASAQPSGITSIIRWPVGTSDNFNSATQYRNSAWVIQQRPATPRVSFVMRRSDMYVLGFIIDGTTYLVSDADASPLSNVHQLGFSSEYATLIQRGNVESLSRLPLSLASWNVAIDRAISQGRPYNFTLSDEELIRNWGTPQRLEAAHKPGPNRGTIP
ncbi:ribosome-inactivating family protein [Corynebacterium diphtheriae]|uniref:ribosome-inactivating family protein n=1 Tax=Corynebacterium diphtheriae TaxID=1717 RepID=UPI000245A5FE|nr:putative secreted protein [Corynebacterium diphtheriae 31A]